MKIKLTALASFALLLGSPAAAQMPPPGATMATQYLLMAGEGDVYEISSAQVALMKSRDKEVRRFATMLTDHHTRTSNGAMAAAAAAGVMAPPAILGPDKRDMITGLMAAGPADFDSTFWRQQVMAHEAALALQSSYAARGDTAQLRAAAAKAVPIVRRHLQEARRMAGTR